MCVFEADELSYSQRLNTQVRGALLAATYGCAQHSGEVWRPPEYFLPRNLMMKQQRNATIPARRSPGSTSSAPPVTHRNRGDKSIAGVRTTDHFRSKDKMIFGTLNVETLWRDGRLEELCHELASYRWNLLGLSEVRKKSFGEIDSD